MTGLIPRGRFPGGFLSLWLVAGSPLGPHAAGQIHTRSPAPPSTRDVYGSPHPAELDQIALNPDNYQRRSVITRGFLEPLTGRSYWSLSLGISRVLLVPGDGTFAGELEAFQGRRVEVTGVVRVLKSCASEPYCPIGHCSLCEDPELPPLPDPRQDWPRASITILSLSDIGEPGGTSDSSRPDREGGRATLEEVLAQPDSASGRDVRIVGQFRGRNLFGDLPADSQRSPSDWVLKEGDRAVWVTGKKAQGKGWRLDAELKSDARWWLEVVGSVEVVGGVVYVRAKRVSLTTSTPPPSEDRH